MIYAVVVYHKKIFPQTDFWILKSTSIENAKLEAGKHYNKSAGIYRIECYPLDLKSPFLVTSKWPR